jgi:2-polyprenyl-6-methoxyphenol hydroxylase-like FAD-dependent oxidoreductase
VVFDSGLSIQALEDAGKLAREFSACPRNPHAAMAAFARKRLEKISRIIVGGRSCAKTVFDTDTISCVLRDQNAVQADYREMALQMARGWIAGLPIGV